MATNQILYIIFFSSIGVFILTFTTLIVKLIRKKKPKAEKENISENVYEDSMEVLEKARTESEQILEDTIKRSQEVLNQTEFIKQEAIKHFDSSIRNLTQQAIGQFQQEYRTHIKDYDSLFTTVKQELINESKNAVIQLQKIIEVENDRFRDALRQQTLDTQYIAEQRINEEYLRAKQEIDLYKQSQIRKIDNSVTGLVERVTQEVLGKTLTATDHEKLILEAFEKAKNEGIFEN